MSEKFKKTADEFNHKMNNQNEENLNHQPRIVVDEDASEYDERD